MANNEIKKNLNEKAEQNEILDSFLSYELSNTAAFCDWMLENDGFEKDVEEMEIPDEDYFLDRMDDDEISFVAKDFSRMEHFVNYLGISTKEELVKIGDDGMAIGCENSYQNLYRIARKIFKGEDFREHFASSTLYYFWQRIVMGTERLQVATWGKNGLVKSVVC